MNLLPLFLLVTVQEDARLAVVADLVQPRLTYAEFGAWVQQKTKVAIYVSPAIRERKATILVENRPVKEVMDRVAEAFFLEWEPTKDGYTLRLQDKAASDESGMIRAEEAALFNGLKDGLDTLVNESHNSSEQLTARFNDASAEVQALSKDTSSEGKKRLADAQARRSRLANVAYNRFYQGAGKVLAQLSPSQRESILNGSPLYASDRSGTGILQMPDGAVDLMRSGGLSKEDPQLFVARYDAGRKQLVFSLASRGKNGASGSSIALTGDSFPSYRETLANQPLRQRLLEWAKLDPTLGATKLAPEDPSKIEPERQTPYFALAELLVKLHKRTGLPIVADGFRAALVSRKPPEGINVSSWLNSLGPWSDNRYRGYRLISRSSGGWLLLRHSQYWKQLSREVPESNIRALETANQKPGGATLEEFAAFAGKLNDAQIPWIGGENPVMEVPYQPLDGNIPFLKLWNAMSSGLRRSALDAHGLLATNMSPEQRRLYIWCIADKTQQAFVSDDALPFVLPQAPPLPSDLRLFVKPEPRIFVTEFREYIEGEISPGWDSSKDVSPGYQVTLGIDPGHPFAFYSVPLHRPADRER